MDKEDTYRLETVVKEQEIVITNGKDMITEKEAIILILNKLDKIEKNIVG